VVNGSSHYDEIVRHLCEDQEVRVTVVDGMRRFGASGELRANGKMFAFCFKGNLIVKLAQSRVAALVAEGQGQPCRMGRRTMREWVVIGPEWHSEWLSLASESKHFVLSKG